MGGYPDLLQMTKQTHTLVPQSRRRNLEDATTDIVQHLWRNSEAGFSLSFEKSEQILRQITLLALPFANPQDSVLAGEANLPTRSAFLRHDLDPPR